MKEFIIFGVKSNDNIEGSREADRKKLRRRR
jgi:hypothetical protein